MDSKVKINLPNIVLSDYELSKTLGTGLIIFLLSRYFWESKISKT